MPLLGISKEFRSQVKAQNQGASFSESRRWHLFLNIVGRILGAAWRNLSEEDRQVCFMFSFEHQVYNRMAEEDKIRYQEEMLLYQKELGLDIKQSPAL